MEVVKDRQPAEPPAEPKIGWVVLCYQIVPFHQTVEMLHRIADALRQAYSDDYHIVKDEHIYADDGAVYHFIIAFPKGQ